MTKTTRLMSTAVILLLVVAAGCGPAATPQTASTAEAGSAGQNMVTLYVPEMSDRLKLL